MACLPEARTRTSVLAAACWRSIACLLICLSCGLGTFAATAHAGNALNRNILGLYDATEERSADNSRLHRHLEMPLNHLGYQLKLHDLSQSLPDIAEASRYHAIATWFSGRIPMSEAYFTWATAVARSGTKFIVLDSIGALGNKEELPAINGFLTTLGLRYAHYFVSDSAKTRIAGATRSMIGFEHKLDPEKLPGHQVIVATSDTITKHLTVTDPGHKWADAPEAVLVTTGPGGGHIASGFAIHYDPERNRVRWIVNPFQFLEAALGRRTWPVPDTTTVSGRRLYFSHIDGDGWLNTTTVKQSGNVAAKASEVVLERLISPFPDLPVSVGLIAGDISTTHGGNVDSGLAALNIFALPQVEVASHTYTHPYRWAEFERYDRNRELDQIQRYVAARGASAEPRLADLVRDRKQTSIRSPSPDASPVTLPRARTLVPFNLDDEVTEALRASQQLAPAGKQVRLYLWSGDTRPFEAALRRVREFGVKNLNGGDSRFDTDYPSVAYVAPLSRTVGAERQIYAVNSNENTYTNGWRGPFDGFGKLTETLNNTEQSRRLKGFNLYYHMYSATRPDSLAVVESHLELARRSRIAPVAASHYAAIAEGFFSTEIVESAPLRWVVSRRGSLDTLRFDHASSLDVDIAGSRGVIGSRRLDDVLYVTLDSDIEPATVTLQPVNRGNSKRRGIELVESRWRLWGVAVTPCRVLASIQGFGPGEMEWRGFLTGLYDVALERDGKKLASSKVNVDSTGTLQPAPFDVSAIEPLQLRISCQTQHGETVRRRIPAGKAKPRTALVPRAR